MSDTPVLEFENVSKSFSETHHVIKNLSFSVKKGEFFSILGPSGCGKTTCLRMISGLENPTHGVLRINGKTVNGVHPHKRNVHTVFQKYALFPHLSVFENVAFGLRMKRRPYNEIQSRVERMLKMVHLDNYASRTIQQLSGGEQQRVALIRALINEPEILLLDEPLAALDLKLREQMQLELSAIQKQLGTTFIFVTHDQGEALTLSDRVAIMNKGNLEQVGTPTEVYEQPASTFVARFVGTTNVFKGKLQKLPNVETVSVETESLGHLYAKVDEGRSHVLSLQNVGLMVRPEKIRIRVTDPSRDTKETKEIKEVAKEPPKDSLREVLKELRAEAEPLAKEAVSIPKSNGKINVLRGVLAERIYFGPTTQIKLKVPVRGGADHFELLALIANQTATKMPALKVGEKYFAVWDASDSILVSES